MAETTHSIDELVELTGLPPARLDALSEAELNGAVASAQAVQAFREDLAQNGGLDKDNQREHDVAHLVIAIADAIIANGMTLPPEPLAKIRLAFDKLEALPEKDVILSR